jgi:hypothetical protein
MADTQPPRVDNEILQMWRRDGRLYAIAGFLVGVMLFPLIGVINESGEIQRLFENLVPEAVGIFVTVAFIYYLDRRRDEKNAEEALKRQLVIDASSVSNEKAIDAVHQLQRRQWLRVFDKECLLKSENLVKANLKNAPLNWANLQGTNLTRAKLQHAELQHANLQNAFMTGTELQGTKLAAASLKRADLVGAKLQQANLFVANLYGANLFAAHLEGADLRSAYLLKVSGLEGAHFDGNTRLPDDTDENPSFWQQGMSFSHFTDPAHPDFWKPSWVKDEEE